VEDLDECSVELLRIEELFLQRELEILRDLIQSQILQEALNLIVTEGDED